eukprot:1178379-Prorocentrum_minimum.AAC.2
MRSGGCTRGVPAGPRPHPAGAGSGTRCRCEGQLRRSPQGGPRRPRQYYKIVLQMADTSVAVDGLDLHALRNTMEVTMRNRADVASTGSNQSRGYRGGAEGVVTVSTHLHLHVWGRPECVVESRRWQLEGCAEEVHQRAREMLHPLQELLRLKHIRTAALFRALGL